ncbi:neuropeptide CCHamide-1 receptor-like [Brevipalpus obovatus]|uniref:neuropeptide CCHamide-1 receptor-like n=1 Tax=Brevipalpus obovatus TaxID=246614 RepID=UPI003D9F1C5E
MIPTFATNYSLTWLERNPSSFIVPILLTPIFVTGFVGNLWLIMMIIRGLAPQTSSNIYTLSLAFGDLIVFLSVFPFMMTLFPIASGPLGVYICKISEFLRDLSVNITALTLIAMSVDRYFAVLSAVNWMRRQGTLRHKFLSFSIVCLIWILSSLLAIPTVLGARVEWVSPTATSIPPSQLSKDLYSVDERMPICYPYPERFLGTYHPKLIVVIKFICLFLVPIGVSGFCNMVVARKLIVNVKSKLCFRKTQQDRALRKAQFTARVAFLFVTMFLFCFLPHHLFSLWFYISPPTNDFYTMFYQTSRIIAFVCAFLNSALNPIIICSTSHHLKKYVGNKMPFVRFFFV